MWREEGNFDFTSALSTLFPLCLSPPSSSFCPAVKRSSFLPSHPPKDFIGTQAEDEEELAIPFSPFAALSSCERLVDHGGPEPPKNTAILMVSWEMHLTTFLVFDSIIRRWGHLIWFGSIPPLPFCCDNLLDSFSSSSIPFVRRCGQSSQYFLTLSICHKATSRELAFLSTASGVQGQRRSSLDDARTRYEASFLLLSKISILNLLSLC